MEELGPDVPLHFSAFHPDFKLTDRGPTPTTTLIAAYDIACQAGLRYVYTGNVMDQEHQHTYCPVCGHVVIQRNGYDVVGFSLHNGCCISCNTTIAGRFDDKSGTWGSHRLPVRIADYA